MNDQVKTKRNSFCDCFSSTLCLILVLKIRVWWLLKDISDTASGYRPPKASKIRSDRLLSLFNEKARMCIHQHVNHCCRFRDEFHTLRKKRGLKTALVDKLDAKNSGSMQQLQGESVATLKQLFSPQSIEVTHKTAVYILEILGN